MNTKKNGKITFLVFKEEKAQLYTGVCLDFGIVYQNKNKKTVECELKKASLGYLETVKKEKMDDDFLNNQAEKKYFDLYDEFLRTETNRMGVKKEIKNPFVDVCVNVLSTNQLKDCYV